jgi:hypothetical protein
LKAVVTCVTVEKVVLVLLLVVVETESWSCVCCCVVKYPLLPEQLFELVRV